MIYVYVRSIAGCYFTVDKQVATLVTLEGMSVHMYTHYTIHIHVPLTT